MKALILVGGFGTRLRPLTISCPKPLVEFVNLPIICHQIEALAKVGVAEIVLAVGYNPAAMLSKIKEFEETYKVKITCSQEETPLGTAGPLKLAEKIIKKDNDENLFFVLNSDITCEFPLQELLDYHKQHGKEGTIMLTQVQDPSKFGVVLYDENGQITQFIEKPQDFVGDFINAGLYIFNTKIIDRIQENEFSMLEKQIFPVMAQQGQLYCKKMQGFWADIGTPKDFILGTQMILDSYSKYKPNILSKGKQIVGNVIIDQSAKISKNCLIGPNVVIGSDCVVEDGVRLKNCILLKKCKVRKHSWINETIVGWHSSIGEWTRIEGLTVLGEDVHIKDKLFLNGVYVLPNKTLTQTVAEKGKIVM